MHLLVVGGTGRAGRALVARALRAGHRVRVLSRGRPGLDPARGAGDAEPETVTADLLAGALPPAVMAGVDAVVDVSNVVTGSYARATRFFRTSTETLVAAERAAGVPRHVVLSIVGVDHFPGGYYRAKVDQEQVGARACTRAGITHTIARVTQFHDFAAMTYAGGRIGPVVLVPPLHLAPVHLDDVADHLLDLLDHPEVRRPEGGRAPELTGPRPEDLDDMVRRYAALRHRPARVVRLPLPGAYGRANRLRVLAGPGAGRRGTLDFGTWLEGQASAASVHPGARS